MEIRTGTTGDIKALNELYNHFVRTSPATFDIDEIPLSYHEEWFASLGGPYRLLVACDDDGFAGYAYSGPVSPRRAYETSIATSVYLDERVHGRGVGSALYAQLFADLEGQDLHRAYAGISMPNPASVALHEKFGFTQTGYYTEQGRKFDRYWDVAWFEKVL